MAVSGPTAVAVEVECKAVQSKACIVDDSSGYHGGKRSGEHRGRQDVWLAVGVEYQRVEGGEA